MESHAGNCGDCKHTMVRKTVPRGDKKYYYLICSANKAKQGCSPHSFSEDKLKQIVFHIINGHIELIAQVEKVLDYIAALPEQDRHIINYDALVVSLESEITRYQDLKVNLYFDIVDGVISREEYREFHANYDRRIADRQNSLAGSRRSAVRLWRTLPAISSGLRNLRNSSI